MTESALSNDELEFLANLEEGTAKAKPKKKTTAAKPARKKTEDLDEDSASFALLQDLCEKATKLTKSSYGESGCKDFEVMRPSLLPFIDGSGSENLVGTEKLTFVKFLPTRHRGGIYAIFELPEPRPNVAVWLENVAHVFGSRGEKLVAFLNGPSIQLEQSRLEILDRATMIDRAAEYEGNNDYGTW